MILVTKLMIVLVALLHLYFLYLEMFVWTTKGRKVFKTLPQALFEPTKQMAANQGLYNGFLAVGLIWSLLIKDPVWATNIAYFFLICIVIAGTFGALSVSKKIFFIQALPALIGLILLLINTLMG